MSAPERKRCWDVASHSVRGVCVYEFIIFLGACYEYITVIWSFLIRHVSMPTYAPSFQRSCISCTRARSIMCGMCAGTLRCSRPNACYLCVFYVWGVCI